MIPIMHISMLCQQTLHYYSTKTYVNLIFFCNLIPVLGSHPSSPLKINGHSYCGFLIRHGKTSCVVTSFSCSKCEITRSHTITKVVFVPIRWTKLITRHIIQNQYKIWVTWWQIRQWITADKYLKTVWNSKDDWLQSLEVEVYCPPYCNAWESAMIDVNLETTIENKFACLKTQLIFVFVCFCQTGNDQVTFLVTRTKRTVKCYFWKVAPLSSSVFLNNFQATVHRRNCPIWYSENWKVQIQINTN